MASGTPALQTLRGRTVLIKSVSIFLASGRRASQPGKSRSTTAPAQSDSSNGLKKRSGNQRKKMGDDSSSKSSTNIKFSAKTVELLKRKTHFSRLEIEALFRLYRKLVANNTTNVVSTTGNLAPATGATVTNQQPVIGEGLDRSEFRELLHNTFDLVTEDVLMDRIFCVFDRNNVGIIRQEEWICGLSTFLRGTFEEKAAFCFLVYDLNNDGYISRDEMFHLLRNCLMKQPQDEDPDEGVKDLVELALRKLDVDHDGKVSFQDFQISVKEEPLLLEAFGQCLPAENACLTFLSTLKK